MIEVLVRHVFSDRAPVKAPVTLKSIQDDVLAFIPTGSPEDVYALAAFLSGVSQALNESSVPKTNDKQED